MFLIRIRVVIVIISKDIGSGQKTKIVIKSCEFLVLLFSFQGIAMNPIGYFPIQFV